MHDDLQDTVSSAAAGDQPSLDALLTRFLPGLRAFLAREAGALVRARESVSDLAQSVCREVLERLRDERFEYRGEAQFVRWLQQAAVHKLQNRHRFYRADKRDAGRELTPDGSNAGLAGIAATGGTPSAGAARQEQDAELVAALAKLTERDRQVIQLCHFDGRSHEEVAGILGVTESHSRVLLARALARLARGARGS